MKIAYAVPNTLITKAECKRREELCREWAFPGTEVTFITFEEGPATIESRYEEMLSIPLLAKEAVRLEEEGYDALILGCGNDPGLEILRELTTKMLVTGPMQASLLIAASLGSRFSILTPNAGSVNIAYELASKNGISDKLHAVISLDLNVTDLYAEENKRRITSQIIDVAGKEKTNHHVDTIVFACLSLSYMDITQEVEDALGIRVIHSPRAVLKFTEALVGAGLRHSKAAYPLPQKIEKGIVQTVDELYVQRFE